MIFRLTQKLGTKIKAGGLTEEPLASNQYADWSSHLFSADRTQYIILTNTTSFYSCVMYARGITNDNAFIDRALSCMREFMDDDGQSFAYQKFVAPSARVVSFARTLNRSVVGSINELVFQAKILLTEMEMSPHDVGFKLNDTLMSALASDSSPDYGKPNEAFKLLVSE